MLLRRLPRPVCAKVGGQVGCGLSLVAWSIAIWIDISLRIRILFRQPIPTKPSMKECIRMVLWRDDHVREVRFYALEDDAASRILSGCVKPSMKKSPLYPVFVWLNLTAHILKAHCSCRSGGGGRCKHVASVWQGVWDLQKRGVDSVPADNRREGWIVCLLINCN